MSKIFRSVDCPVRSVDCSVRSVTAVDSKKCYATGRGVQPKGVRVADKAVFKVHTQGAGDGDLKVQVSQPPTYSPTTWCICLSSG